MPRNKQTCFFCGTIEKENVIHTFGVPKGMLDGWRQIIPGIGEKSRLCDIHFEEEHIDKGKVINGVFYPNIRKWTLSKEAVPSKNLGILSCEYKNH